MGFWKKGGAPPSFPRAAASWGGGAPKISPHGLKRGGKRNPLPPEKGGAPGVFGETPGLSSLFWGRAPFSFYFPKGESPKAFSPRAPFSPLPVRPQKFLPLPASGRGGLGQPFSPGGPPGVPPFFSPSSRGGPQGGGRPRGKGPFFSATFPKGDGGPQKKTGGVPRVRFPPTKNFRPPKKFHGWGFEATQNMRGRPPFFNPDPRGAAGGQKGEGGLGNAGKNFWGPGGFIILAER